MVGDGCLTMNDLALTSINMQVMDGHFNRNRTMYVGLRRVLRSQPTIRLREFMTLQSKIFD
jgi:pentose-5-phosphate-3-epimerase